MFAVAHFVRGLASPHFTGVKLEVRETDEVAFRSLSGLSGLRSINLNQSVFEDDARRHVTKLRRPQPLGLGRIYGSDPGRLEIPASNMSGEFPSFVRYG